MTDTVHVDAKLSLHGYQAWRRGLEPLPVDTVVEWVQPHTGLVLSDNIKSGQLFKITAVRAPLMGKATIEAEKVYDMVLVSASGKVFKKKTAWSVESVARAVHRGEVKLRSSDV